MDFYKLSKTVLFQGATPEETEQMLSCLKAGKRKYKKEEMIYRVGEVVSCVGVVLSGSVLIENDDIWGNRSVLERAGEGEIFAETYASIPDQKMLVNVIAAEDTEILFLNVGKMLHLCSNSCIFHNKLIKKNSRWYKKTRFSCFKKIVNYLERKKKDQIYQTVLYKSTKGINENSKVRVCGVALENYPKYEERFDEVEDYLSIRSEKGHEITYPITCSVK